MNWRTTLPILCSALLLTSAVAQTCKPIPASYTVTDLGGLGGSNTYAQAINPSGWVTGESYLSNNATLDAFLWTPSAGMQDLGNLGDDSCGFAINSAGDVAGQADLGNGTSHAFLWTASTGIQDLGILHNGFEAFSVGEGIDDQDRVVGWESDPHGIRALLFTNGKIYDLNKQSGETWTADAINDRGQVAGESDIDAVIWTKAKGLTHLGTLHEGSFSGAFAINPSGTIVAGQDLYQGNIFSALAWIVDSSGNYVMNNLGSGQAYGVNDSCQVVGGSGFNHAFVWTPMDGRKDLNTLIPPNSGLVLHWAFGINNAGQIVGLAMDSHGNNRGYLLTPVP
jgi:probable HAF family extracellular repeat protein